MHEVHTLRRLVVPPPAGVRTVWMFGFQRRLVRRCEWDTLWPKPGLLPHTSHTLATEVSWVDFEQPVKSTGRLPRRANRPSCRGASIDFAACWTGWTPPPCTAGARPASTRCAGT